MPEKKIITVLGATGAQGGGVVRAIQNDPSGGFIARAVTRDVNSDKAKALKALGAEVVAGDVDDEASLRQAFAGAHGAYCVTFFWAHFTAEKETAEGITMARAAKAAGVKHVIWSTLEDTREYVAPGSGVMPVLMGKYNVPHFDAKGEANRAFTDRQVPTTLLYTSFYWDNLIHFGMQPQRGADGKLAFVLPMAQAKLPGIAAADIGPCAFGIFERGESLIGKSIGIAGEHLSGAQMAAQLSTALGEPVTHAALSPAEYRALDFAGADDLGNMFQFKRDFEQSYCASRSLACARDLNPQLQTFATWLACNKGRLPIH
jgi:uncharacterized protein YbjT (DUF2867 family)